MMGAQQGSVIAGLQQLPSVVPGMYITAHAVLLHGHVGQGFIAHVVL